MYLDAAAPDGLAAQSERVQQHLAGAAVLGALRRLPHVMDKCAVAVLQSRLAVSTVDGLGHQHHHPPWVIIQGSLLKRVEQRVFGTLLPDVR